MKTKKIIALRGKTKVGKTTSIRETYKKLEKHFDLKIIIPVKNFKDIFTVFEINNTIVGMCSAGDTKEIVDKHLKECIKHNCALIICACRTSGGPYEKVMEYAKKYEYGTEFIDVPEISNETRNILLGRIAYNLLLNVDWTKAENM